MTFFLGRTNFRSNDGYLAFVYQLGLYFRIKKITHWFCSQLETKAVFNSKLKSFDTLSLHTIKRSRYKMERKFDKHSLAVEQNNYPKKF